MEWNTKKVKFYYNNFLRCKKYYLSEDLSCRKVILYFYYSIFYEPKEFYTNVDQLMSSDKGGVAVAMGWKVKRIDVVNKIVILEDGYEIKYNKCLIATGEYHQE